MKHLMKRIWVAFALLGENEYHEEFGCESWK